MAAATPVKPGYKSTEFWLSLGASLLGFLFASGVLEMTSTTWDDQGAGLLATILATMGYTVSRAVVKK